MSRRYSIPDPLEFRFVKGKHAGKKVREVLQSDPEYIWEDWGHDQNFMQQLRDELTDISINDDDDDIAVAEQTDETDEGCPVFEEWARHYNYKPQEPQRYSVIDYLGFFADEDFPV